MKNIDFAAKQHDANRTAEPKHGTAMYERMYDLFGFAFFLHSILHFS